MGCSRHSKHTTEHVTVVHKNRTYGGLTLLLDVQPEKFVQVQLIKAEMFSMGGSFDPCASIDFTSIGLEAAGGREGGMAAVTDEIGPIFAGILCEVCSADGLSPDRIYVNTYGKGGDEVCWDGKTFMTRRKEKEAAAAQ